MLPAGTERNRIQKEILYYLHFLYEPTGDENTA